MPLLGCMLHRNLKSFDVAGDPISSDSLVYMAMFD